MSHEHEPPDREIARLTKEIMKIEPRFTEVEAANAAQTIVFEVASHLQLGCTLGFVDHPNNRNAKTDVCLIKTPDDESEIRRTLADMYSRSQLPTIVITDDNGAAYGTALLPTVRK